MQNRFELFTVLVSNINRSIRKIKTMEMAEVNLKGPHVSCLYYLYKMRELTAKELCDICQEDKAATSRSLDFLETNGYVTCHSDAKKRYKTPFTLTEKGEQIGEYIAEKIDSILDRASEGLTDEERAVLYKSLALINDNLKNICNTENKQYGN